MATAKKNARTKRDEFSERTKGDIFVRDGALCCYTGASLWLLDYGAAQAAPAWFEHIVPASKKGDSSLENGILANWYFNKSRSNLGEPVFMYRCGLPSDVPFALYEEIPERITAHYERFLSLHWSDYYVNQAVFHFRLAAGQEFEQRLDGKAWVRGREKRCATVLNALTKGRAAGKGEKIAPLAERGLLPIAPGPDHGPLLQMLDATNTNAIEAAVLDFVRYLKADSDVRAEFRAMAELADAEEAAAEFVKKLRSNELVSARTKHLLGTYLDRLIAMWTRNPRPA